MKVEITYPHRSARRRGMDIARLCAWITFALAGVICVLVNLFVGGKAWSVIVLWSFYMLWTFVFSPNLVEYNRISQLVKLITTTSILLVLIGALLSPGWAARVVPLVCMGGLVTAGILFFTDFEKQRQNMMPMLWLSAAALVSVGVATALPFDGKWEYPALGATALVLLLACAIIMGSGMLRELKKRFHTK